MSSDKLLKNISSKFILKQIFSHLQLNISYKIIKYNKSFQKKLDVNFEDSIINYQYNIQTKDDILGNILDMECNLIKSSQNYISSLSFQIKFYLKYSYSLSDDCEDIEIFIFLIKYKGFKINEYPLPFNFDFISFRGKMNILENNEYFYEYTLNDENIELIYLINEFRVNNNLNKLICNKIENLIDFFREKNSNNKNKYLFKYTFKEFKKILLEKMKKLQKYY